MDTKRIYILIILFLLLGSSQAQTNLDTYLKTGAENNPGLKAKFSEYNAALEKVPQVGTLPDPTISFGYFISPVETRLGPQQAKIGFMQMFPWFGTLGAKEDVATQQAKAKYEEFEEAKSKLFFDIKSAYYNLYFAQKGIAITRENISILNTFQQLALIKIETGKASVVDEMRVVMERNELENQLAYLLDTKWVLEVSFNKLLNQSVETPIVVPDELLDENLGMSKQALLDSITNQNHLIKQLDFKMASFQKQEIAAHKMGSPTFSIGMDYMFIGDTDSPMAGNEGGKDAIVFPMVGITIPLYRKKYKAMINEASLNIEATQFQKENQQNQLTILFEKGYKDYADGERRIVLFQKQLKLAKKSLDILLTSYSNNGQNFEEVLRMERKVLKYALELDKARADKNAAVAFISYLLGK
ncbi:MAG: TolC family protein [Flavobacteriales bacterium]|nr:TolC family protein [Flavobacteriales bacterium]MCB9363129.1 TolC family protein [Flavobacteriales bacterium]